MIMIIFLPFQDSAHFDKTLFFDDRHYTWGNVNDPVNLKNYLDQEVAEAFQNGIGLKI